MRENRIERSGEKREEAMKQGRLACLVMKKMLPVFDWQSNQTF